MFSFEFIIKTLILKSLKRARGSKDASEFILFICLLLFICFYLHILPICFYTMSYSDDTPIVPKVKKVKVVPKVYSVLGTDPFGPEQDFDKSSDDYKTLIAILFLLLCVRTVLPASHLSFPLVFSFFYSIFFLLNVFRLHQRMDC